MGSATPKKAGEGPLAGLKVLEYGEFISAPYCGKLMADLGAEVIKIESPSHGDTSRRHGPFSGDVPDPEKSGLFLFLNTNKMGITLNLETCTGLKIFRELVKDTDVLIESHSPMNMRKLGVDYQSLKENNPDLIMTSITPFGQTGPYRDYQASDINICALSGWSLLIGEPGREPLTPPLSVGHFMAGVAAGIATVLAVLARLATGGGQYIDISEAECHNSFFTGVLANSFIYYNRKRTRSGHRTPFPYPYTVLPCKDGYMSMIAVQGYQWKRFLEIVGNGSVPEWYENDPRFKDRMRAGREYADELDMLFAPWLEARTRQEIFESCRKNHVPFAPVRTIDEVVNDRHLNERGFFVELAHPKVGSLKYPGPPYRLSKSPWRLKKPAPLLGQHNEEVYCSRLGYPKHDLSALRGTGVI